MGDGGVVLFLAEEKNGTKVSGRFKQVPRVGPNRLQYSVRDNESFNGQTKHVLEPKRNQSKREERGGVRVAVSCHRCPDHVLRSSRPPGRCSRDTGGIPAQGGMWQCRAGPDNRGSCRSTGRGRWDAQC